MTDLERRACLEISRRRKNVRGKEFCCRAGNVVEKQR